MEHHTHQAIDLDALEAAVNASLAEEPVDVEQVDAAKLAGLMERAKKLLGMAEGGATQAERDAFADKAAGLMARYGITAAMLADGGRVSDAVGDWVVEVAAPYCLDKAALFTSVVDAYGGKVIRTERGAQSNTLRAYAMGADLTRIKVLWPSLLTQMTTELGWATVGKPANVRADVFGRNFIHGFTSAVTTRLRAAEERARDEAQAEQDTSETGRSVALVLADRKGQVERRFKDDYPRVKKSRRQTRMSVEGIAAGVRAGQRADIGQVRVGR